MKCKSISFSSIVKTSLIGFWLLIHIKTFLFRLLLRRTLYYPRQKLVVELNLLRTFSLLFFSLTLTYLKYLIYEHTTVFSKRWLEKWLADPDSGKPRPTEYIIDGTKKQCGTALFFIISSFCHFLLRDITLESRAMKEPVIAVCWALAVLIKRPKNRRNEEMEKLEEKERVLSWLQKKSFQAVAFHSRASLCSQDILHLCTYFTCISGDF